MTAAEVHAMMRACRRARFGRRDRALIALMYRTGVRVSSACGIDLYDLFEQDGQRFVRIEKIKGGLRIQSFPIDLELGKIIDEWLEVRGREPGPLFSTHRGARLHTSSVRRMFQRLAPKAGIERRVHPHALRHTFAAELYTERIGAAGIQAALGHSSLATTQKYLGQIGCEEVAAYLTDRKWRA